MSKRSLDEEAKRYFSRESEDNSGSSESGAEEGDNSSSRSQDHKEKQFVRPPLLLSKSLTELRRKLHEDSTSSYVADSRMNGNEEEDAQIPQVRRKSTMGSDAEYVWGSSVSTVSEKLDITEGLEQLRVAAQTSSTSSDFTTDSYSSLRKRSIGSQLQTIQQQMDFERELEEQLRAVQEQPPAEEVQRQIQSMELDNEDVTTPTTVLKQATEEVLASRRLGASDVRLLVVSTDDTHCLLSARNQASYAVAEDGSYQTFVHTMAVHANNEETDVEWVDLHALERNIHARVKEKTGKEMSFLPLSYLTAHVLNALTDVEDVATEEGEGEERGWEEEEVVKKEDQRIGKKAKTAAAKRRRKRPTRVYAVLCYDRADTMSLIRLQHWWLKGGKEQWPQRLRFSLLGIKDASPPEQDRNTSDVQSVVPPSYRLAGGKEVSFELATSFCTNIGAEAVFEVLISSVSNERNLITTVSFDFEQVLVQLCEHALRSTSHFNSVDELYKFQQQKNFEISYSCLSDFQRIGSGAFGEVSKAQLYGVDVVVKKIIAGLDVDGSIKNEILALSKARHPNVVSFLGITRDPNDPSYALLVTEYVNGGDLRQYLSSQSYQKLSVVDKLRLCETIASTFQFLHDLSIIHRDLKPENVLITRDMIPKIADFGLSRIVDISQSNAKTANIPGTVRYMAPEIVTAHSYSKKVDVYSFGILMNELLTGAVPFEETFSNQMAILFNVTMNKLRPELPALEEVSVSLRENILRLIESCWDPDPHRRPEFAEIRSTLSECIASMKM